MVLRLLKSVSIAPKIQKCTFFTNRLVLLDDTLRPGQIKVANHNADVIRELKKINTATELQLFLGLCAVFRRAISDLTTIASPLSTRLKKTYVKRLGPLENHELQALHTSREELKSPPAISLTNQTGHYTLDQYACDKQVRCVIIQDNMTGKKPDRSDIDHECLRKDWHLDTTQQKRLAMDGTSLLLRSYLDDARSKSRTDYHTLYRMKDSLFRPIDLRTRGPN